MDSGTGFFISLTPVEVGCVIIFLVALITNGVLRSFLSLSPAKQRSDLQGMRKLVTIISAFLVFLVITCCGYLVYIGFTGSYPSPSMFIFLCLVGLGFSYIQKIKLHYLDIASVKTYEWLDGPGKGN